MKHLVSVAAAVALTALSAGGAGAQEKVRIAVGGKSAVFYLPLSVAERLGAFKEAGLDVEISDVSSGGRTLQSVVGGSAEIGIGTFDHAIQMQAKNQPVVALVQYGRYPGFVLAMMKSKAGIYNSPKDLKGLKIGVTSPGSSTHFMAAYMLVRSGLKADDASFVGTGTTSTAVAAARRGEIDAIVSSDPMMTMMESDDLVKVVADTRTASGTKAVYGGPYPGGVIYATPAYIEKNPQAVQKVVNAFVRSLKWIDSHSAEDIAKLMPEEYALGNLPIYIKALTVSKPMYSPDGHFEAGAVGTAYAVLRVFDPAVAAASFDLTKTYNDSFVKKAISGR
ncbi:MAG: ABC transporter substrate-binding protein [Hyphomicrobiales bacterium]|nr:ABC transporter substrate-binding protein [Alphaproteobacteria bacterium]